MSKELEALYKLSQIEFETGDYMNDDGYMMKIVSTEMYDILKKSLTPPTADEVCEALSEFYGKKVIYVADVKKFAYEGVDGWQEICYFGKNFKGDVIRFSFSLPPRLITLIGRFYEGLEEMK